MKQLGLAGFDDPGAQAPMHRLFFALWPDATLRARIDAVADRLVHEHAAGGRRLRADRYHLTLQFLGDFRPLPPQLLDRARAAADSLRVPAFQLPLDYAGSFRGSDVWWLGSGEQTPAGLQRLWDELGAALARQGVPSKGGKFSPHLTIQRDVRRHIAPTPLTPLPWSVNEFVLIDSQPGQPYSVLARWPLQA